MILDLKKIKFSGKTQESFFFEYIPEKQLVSIPSAEIVLPIKVNGTVTLTGDHQAFVEGEINYCIKGDCTRCLAPIVKDYVAEFSEEVSSENENGYVVINDKVNLAQIVDDAIIIAEPVSFLCKEDCLGLCQGCGVNLNQEQCKCNK